MQSKNICFLFLMLSHFIPAFCTEKCLIVSLKDEKSFIIRNLDLQSISRYHRTCKEEYNNIDIDNFLLTNPSFLYNLNKYDYINALVHYGRSSWIPTQEELKTGQKSIKKRIFKNLLSNQVKPKNTELRHVILHAIPAGFSLKHLDKTWFNRNFFLHHISITSPAFGIYENDLFSFKQDHLNLWVILKICRDLNNIDNNLNTTLHAACKEGNLKAVKIITEKKIVDINRKLTPLVPSTDRTDIQQETININSSNICGHTPLHLGCLYFSLNTELISNLLEHGAQINAQDKLGNLPIHLACQGKNFIFVNFLLKHGAFTNVQNIDGDLPLHIACKNNDFMSAFSLLHHSPDTANIKNGNEMTPLDIACQQSNHAIVSLFQKSRNKLLSTDTITPAKNRTSSMRSLFINNDFVTGSLFGLITIGLFCYCYKKLAYCASS